MKLERHILTILSIALLFLLIGSVSAADTNDTQTVSASGNDEILSVENDVDVLGEGEYNYTQLKDQFRFDGDITLIAGNYTYVSGDGDTIEITTSRVIDGNGAVIDMANSDHRAFHVTTDGVTIKNLTIKNANHGHGGAIYFSSSGTVENCNFIGNKATDAYRGGAVYFSSSGTVENCNFTDNQASRGGGAVYFVREGTVTNCNFTNNKATGDEGYGGAIYFENSGNPSTVTNCNFTNNTAIDGNGGAIFFENSDNPSTVTNCNFTNNTASRTGGAIYFAYSDNPITVANCNFVNNTVNSQYYGGGAIFFASAGNVTNCNFTGNNAIIGSAIYFHWKLATKIVSNSTFLNNRAKAENLEVTKKENNITITFTGKDNLLNAIYSNDDVTFTNVTYWGANGTNNTGISAIKPLRSNREAGQNITVEIYDSRENLVDNVTLVTDDNGQVTYDLSQLSNGNYTCNAYHLEDCYYTYREYKDFGDFNRLQRYINGADANSVLTLYRDYTFTVGLDENLTGGIVIDKPLTISGNGHTIDALQKARIFKVTATSINITGLTFKNGKADKGGAIYFSNYISNSNINASFINNKADYGGANYFNKEVSGSNITGTYTNNTATEGSNGGANYFYWHVSGSNITGTYTNNNATRGGANYFWNSVSGSTITGTYTNNKAEHYGGANYFHSVSDSNITGTYTNNKANGQGDYYGGGANYFQGSVSDSNITGTYTNNTATGNGGANYFRDSVSGSNVGGIYINNTASDSAIIYFQDYWSAGLNAEISNAIFLNNNCNYEIYVRTPGVVVKDSWFGNNASNYMNKPNIDDKVQIENWLFLNATADYSSLLVMGSSNITFKLYSTNGTNVSDFDNSKLPVVNLTLTATNGDVENTTTLDNIVKYMATEKGKGSVTAKIENTTHTIYFENIPIDVDLSVSAQNITYLENEVLTLTYNNTATGKVNITLKSKNYNKTIERDVNQTITIADLPAGDYDVTVEYFGDNVFLNDTSYANFTVNKKTTEVIPDKETIELFVDEESKITYTLTPENALGNISFSSDDSDIVSVNSTSGDIAAKGEGSANITVSFSGSENYTASKATITVNVKKIPTQITVNSSHIDMKANGEAVIAATLTPADAGNLTYKSGDENIVKIEDGMIIALKEGNATITVSFKGDNKYAAAENKTINVTVSLNDASVSVNNKTLDLLIDGTFTIVATTTPEGLNVSFVPDDSGVYSIDENGNVIGLREGEGSILIKVGGDGVYVENYTIVNVTVSKIPTEITVDSDSLDLFVGDETFIVATLTPADAGNVSFKSSDDSIVIVDAQGNVIANGKGQAIITVSFAGDNKYAESENKTITVNVSLNDASVSVDNDTLDLKVDDTYQINATRHPDTILLEITYTSSDNSVASVDENGVVTALGEGTAIITLSVGDDEIYAENSTTVTVTVSKISTEISIANATVTLNVDDEVAADALLTPEEAGSLTYTSSDESVAIFNDGKIIALKEGKAVITISFAGDNKYAAAENKTIKVSVKKVNANMDVSADEITEGENATISITLPGDATGNVSVSANGKTYAAPINNGKSTVTIPDLTENITASVSYAGDDKYNPATTTVNITVNKNATVTVTAQNLTKYYKDPQKFTVKVTDAKGQAATNKTVNITINGVTYKRTTDEKGTASLNINLNSGTYPTSVAVDDVKVNYTVTVKPTIDASDVVKVFRNDTQYNAIFTDSNGKPLPNISVSFNIHGIIYNRTTDENGAAKLNINLDAGDYILTAFNSFTGEMVSNMIKVISLVESNDLTKYYRNDSQFVVRIHTADGGYVGAGEEVTFNINGALYARTTNETGHAKLNINLPQGNYTITTYYKNCSRGNEIAVLPVLSADDLVMKYRDGSQFKAKLVDGQGKAYAGQSVRFNINGVLYTRVTGSDGVAQLNINLMAGQYIITSSYNGLNIANKITISG